MFETIEGNGYYNIVYDTKLRGYYIYDIENHCYLDDTFTTDLQCAEKIMENLSE